MRFFVGIPHAHIAHRFDASFISVHTLKRRQSAFAARDWIMDSGAFTTIQKHGGYPHPVSEYAAQIRRWKDNGNLLAAVSQDYMCEKHMLEKTGLTIADHQRLTIERYDALLAEDTGVYIMPVLQGYSASEYRSHIRQYGDRLKPGMWVGVGSVCKRNANTFQIWRVLDAIKEERPDLLLHGFGLKKTSLQEPIVRELLHSADSMAWSFAARRDRVKNSNHWTHAAAFIEDISTAIWRSTRQARLLSVVA